MRGDVSVYWLLIVPPKKGILWSTPQHKKKQKRFRWELLYSMTEPANQQMLVGTSESEFQFLIYLSLSGL
jgi:hypothetical protein